MSGNLGELVRDTVTGAATDNEGNIATDSDGATVGVGGGGAFPGAVTLNKSVSPTTLPEPGGDFTFTVTVSGEPFFTVLALIDDVYGDLNGQGDCVLPQVAVASGTYTCSFPGAFSGDPGDSQTDVVGVIGADVSGPFVRFDSATVDISDILPALEVTKTATPNPIDEPGGAVTFGVAVTNTSQEAAFLTLLTDDVYGDLDGRGDCVADGSVAIAPGATYTCSFSEDVTGNAGDVRTDFVLAQLSDDDGNDAFALGRADVTIDDVLPSIAMDKTPRPASVPEPGGTVSFGVVVTNTSIEPVEITSLSDDVYGDLDGQGSCVLPQTIAPGERYICSFPATVSGNAGDTATDVITASGADDEGNPVVGTASASVPITESAPSLSISKVASPASLPEPGGSVSYTVTITNSSVSTDPVTVDSLSDSIEGAPGVVPADLACVSGGADVGVPFTLASGASAVCTFGGSVSGNAGDSTSDTFTASGTDDEGAPARGSGSETVPITDVLPTMTVVKSSVPNPIPEPGGVVDYTATITNTSPETITLTVLNDDVAGPLSASCGLPADIAAGASFVCSWSGSVSGDVGDVRSNVVSATANDDDGNTVLGLDQDDVVIGDLDPVIRAQKVAAPTSLPEPGGTVSFTVTVTNDSVEPVTLQTIPDDVYGDLDGQGTCQLPQTLTANGGFYTCTFRGPVTGSAADSPYTDTFSPTVTDNEGNVGSAVATAEVVLTDRVPAISVVKNRQPASLPEPGGVFTFPIVVTNDSTIEDVVLTDLDDDIYGDIADASNPALVSTTCAVPQTIAPGASYACEFSGEFLGDAGQSQRDVVTATAADDEGNIVTDDDPATVRITDVLPRIGVSKTPDPASLPEPGGDVTFSVTISNLSTVEAVSLTDLVDDVYGDITVTSGDIVTTTCVAAAGDRHRWHLCLCVHGTGQRNRGRLAVHRHRHGHRQRRRGQYRHRRRPRPRSSSPTSARHQPHQEAHARSLPEPGGTFTFSLVVSNDSVEPVTLTSLDDDVYGDVTALPGDCTLPQLIDVGASYSCAFEGEFSGNAGDSQTDTVTATASDDEGNTVTADASAEVELTDVAPAISLTKEATPLTLPEPGGTFTFSLVVSNDSVEPVTLTSLDDDVYGDVTALPGDCTLPQLIDVGASYSCAFEGEFSGNAGDSQTDTVTATASDDEGNTVTTDALAEVELTDLPSSIAVIKDASPTEVDEPGAQVVFDVSIENTSDPDSVTIESIGDDIFGDVTLVQGDVSATDCSVPQVLGPGETYACSFTALVSGDPDDVITDTVTADGSDDDGAPVSAADTAEVTILDALPAIAVDKTADPPERPEPGGIFSFRIEVANAGVEPIELTSLDRRHLRRCHAGPGRHPRHRLCAAPVHRGRFRLCLLLRQPVRRQRG